MDKTKESLVDNEICDGEIPASTFIRIGQSLDMPGEIDKEELKVLPRLKVLNILSKKDSVIISSNLKK
jgi:hypothetical protein